MVKTRLAVNLSAIDFVSFRRCVECWFFEWFSRCNNFIKSMKPMRISAWFVLFGYAAVMSVQSQTRPQAADGAFMALKTKIEANYFSHDRAAVLPVLSHALAQIEKHPDALYPHYYAGLINIQLGNIARALDRKAAYAYYQEAVNHLQAAHEHAPNAETAVVLADAYGKLASLKTLKMLYYGSRSKSYLKAAFKYNLRNPKCHLIAGMEIMWTPAIFGGSKKRARTFLNDALALTRDWQESDPLLVSWATAAEILAHLAQLEILCGAPDRARRNANQALRLVPDYAFVHRDILPQLEAAR